jgi:hypothetical protein
MNSRGERLQSGAGEHKACVAEHQNSTNNLRAATMATRRLSPPVRWMNQVVGFIVTNLARPAERVVAFYNQRGTAEQYITKGKSAI